MPSDKCVQVNKAIKDAETSSTVSILEDEVKYSARPAEMKSDEAIVAASNVRRLLAPYHVCARLLSTLTVPSITKERP